MFTIGAEFKPELISLACRHHIQELIIARVFDAAIGPSSGPHIKLFQRFASTWETIDKSDYKSAMDDASVLLNWNQ